MSKCRKSCNKNNLLWPGCHNLKVRRFSQGPPCKTPLRTHSKQAMPLPSTQAMLLPSTQASPNPWTVHIPNMPHLTQWKQDTDLLPLCVRKSFKLALLGVRREFILKSRRRINQNASNPALDSEVQVQFHWCRDIGTPMRLGQKELKQWAERN